MVIYISGAIAGDPGYEAKFAAAEAGLAAAGHTVINPALNTPGLKYIDYIRISLAQLEAADAIYLLPDWGTSLGARAELAVAQAVGKHVLLAGG